MIIEVPFSAGGLGKTKGCEKAPAKIVSLLGVASEKIPVDNLDIELSHNLIEKKVASLEPSILVGGDHSITYPAVKGMRGKFTLVVLDAHPDLMDNFVPPTHEDYLRAIIENVTSEVILIGARKIDPIEQDYIDEKKIRCVSDMDEIKEILSELDDVYLSIDIDCIDPKEAPGTGYIEKGGFSSEQVLEMIRFLKGKIKMADVVEVNPDKDEKDMTSELAAKLIKEISSHY